ncbi:MAG: hypothetical protein IAE67_09870 [Candidatus Competibacteraceae bacterium]|nr:hypothetical protein [Candidatus Competibacteraceae bacterium]
MKSSIVIWVGMLGLIALMHTGCDANLCNLPQDDRYENDTLTCNADSTVFKFLGQWTGFSGPYPFTVSQPASGEYSIDVLTNLGLTNGSGIQNDPVLLNGWQVVQYEATLSTRDFYGGQLSNARLLYANPNVMSIQYTLSGFSQIIDGNYDETIVK